MKEYFNQCLYWLETRWQAILIAFMILLAGWVAAKLVRGITTRTCSKLKIGTNLQELVVPLSYWSIIVASILFAVGIVISRVLDMDSVWFFTGVFTMIRVVLIFAVGMSVINLLVKVVRKMLAVSKVEPTLHSFLCSAIKCTLILFLVIACIDMMGIPTSSIVAAIASAGLAISLAMQNHLSNLIGGVVILMTKPFSKGDYIEMDGVGGVVESIELIYTTLKTFDNKTIHIPNNDAAKAKITNHSQETNRRLDLTFSIGYADNYELARKLILNVISNTALAHKTPEPMVRMVNHGANSIEIACRVWVDWQDYYELSCFMREEVKSAFDKNGIKIPFTQLSVHIE